MMLKMVVFIIGKNDCKIFCREEQICLRRNGKRVRQAEENLLFFFKNCCNMSYFIVGNIAYLEGIYNRWEREEMYLFLV